MNNNEVANFLDEFLEENNLDAYQDETDESVSNAIQE